MNNKSSITRKSFANNFLKHIILRLDFNGVLQPEMDNVLVQIKKYLKEKQFTRYEEKIGNEIELNFGSPNADISDSIKEVRQTKVFSFTNEDEGYGIELSTSFVILKVNASKYVRFEEYAKLFIEICNIYKENIDFFTVKRFGLRKINFCFVYEIDKVKKYFSERYYNCYHLFKESNVLATDKRTTLNIDKYNLNIINRVEMGKLQEDVVYKIVLDTDINSEDQDTIENMLFTEKNMDHVNDRLFKVYVDVLTEEFSKLLIGANEDIPKDLLGVDSNE